MASTPTPAPTLAPPSAKTLVVTMAVAVGVAVVALLGFVLPAEYGIDPTGVGGLLGLTRMTETPPATVPMAEAGSGTASFFDEPPKSETVALEIGAHEEIEYKMGLVGGATVLFSWRTHSTHTDSGTLYSDFHGDPYNDLDGSEVRYAERTDVATETGSLRAPYSGMHGWYWRNDNDFPVQVTLEVTGYFTHMQEMHRAPAQAAGHPVD